MTEKIPVRQLTESRIRELLAGMPAFNERIRERGRTKGSRTPLPLPAPENYPPVASLADVVAPSFSDDPEDVAFYRDAMRLQELWTYVQSTRGSARAQVDAAIGSLRQQTAGITSAAPDAHMATLFSTMIAARIADLESITDEELEAVARFAPEIEKAMMHDFQSGAGARRVRSGRPSKKRPGE
jgi:hypothetical protein